MKDIPKWLFLQSFCIQKKIMCRPKNLMIMVTVMVMVGVVDVGDGEQDLPESGGSQ